MAAAEGSARREDLLRALRDAAGGDGFLPFDRYLEIVLYAPGLGYYARPGLSRGRGGDYYTATHVHPLFGRTLARRALEEFARCGRPPSFRIVDAGAGDGTLAADLAAELARAPSGPLPEIVLLEALPGLLEAVAPRVAEAGGGRVEVRIGRSLAEEAPFAGVVIANELLDALPFRRLVRRGDAWLEQGVLVGPLGPRFEEHPSGRRVPGEPLPEAPDGTVVELSEAAEGWLRELADALVRGAALLLDYGDEEAQLLRRFPLGSLQGIRSHRVRDDPLADPGEADLSAFVNFSRVRAASRRAGLRELAFSSQAEALGRWGFEAVRDAALASAGSAEEEVRIRLAAKKLLFGFENFRALELAVG